jgi:isoleucyl-tRNA synthetase
MTDEAEEFKRLYYEEANEAIVKALQRENGVLRSDKFTHSYPHDWRTKKPVIFRATPQWFASIEQLKMNY